MQDSGLDDTQLRKLIQEQLMSDAVVNKVTENISTKAEQVHAEHILVTSQEDADKVLGRLQAGEDFAKVAKEVSTDPSAQENGGDLGWFPRGMMVKEFEDAAFDLQPNQTSPVVKSSFGFHIIRVLERDPAREVDPQLLDGLRQQAFGKWLDDQRTAAKIETFNK
ncbi:MAG: peptidyl-prolyl cis-trans isomerase [Chloroflexi bacterium]|nr:peptidyl-prolyl cis-trans isomerase [Chloroflexota bacterium]